MVTDPDPGNTRATYYDANPVYIHMSVHLGPAADGGRYA